MICDRNEKGKRRMWRETNCSGCKVERKVTLKARQHEKRTAVYVEGKNKVKLKAGQQEKMIRRGEECRKYRGNVTQTTHHTKKVEDEKATNSSH